MAAKKNVLQQDINKTTREFTRKKLETVYLAAQELEKLTPAVTKTANDLEAQLYKEFSKKPKDYITQIAKLQIFLNPKHYVGQFAKMFRVKTLQNVYTPERLIQLDITDMLPEVFLNPKANPAAKLDVYQNINRLVAETFDELHKLYNAMLDPTARVPTRPKPVPVEDIDILISKHQTNVQDLCDNPYWKMKKVNTIICKENGKFYCLDTEKLLEELAKNNTATNYFTNKALPQEIADNLRSRYATEIQEIQSSGKPVELGERTSEELVNLEKTLEKLSQFRDLFRKETVIGQILLFGLEEIEDPKNGGVPGVLANIPPQIQDEFEYSLLNDTNAIFIEKTNAWLDDNIKEIQQLLAGKEPVKVSKPAIVAPAAPKKTPEPVKEREAEEKFVQKEILKKNTVSSGVYNDYLSRLQVASKTILEALKTTHAVEARAELTSQLADTQTQLKQVREQGRTIKGVMALLGSALTAANIKLSELSKATGMGLLYPQELVAAQQEQAELEKFVKNLQTEIAYLQDLHTAFTKGAEPEPESEFETWEAEEAW